MEQNRPGGTLLKRTLQFFWLVDCSGSMTIDGKIESLNLAIRNAIPEMQRVAKSNPNADVRVRVISFANQAKWEIFDPVPIEDFSWTDVTADGLTHMGDALKLAAEQLKSPPMDTRGLPPVVILITDGDATDDFAGGLKAFMDEMWGQKAVRLGIGIGRDAKYDKLEQFIGNPEIKPMQAGNAETLVNYIRIASTSGISWASNPNVKRETVDVDPHGGGQPGNGSQSHTSGGYDDAIW